MFKEQKGITLVALIITIIVMLILAGVSISLVLGDDGIATRATEAADKMDQAEARQAIELGFSDLVAELYKEKIEMDPENDTFYGIRTEVYDNDNITETIVENYVSSANVVLLSEFDQDDPTNEDNTFTFVDDESPLISEEGEDFSDEGITMFVKVNKSGTGEKFMVYELSLNENSNGAFQIETIGLAYPEEQ